MDNLRPFSKENIDRAEEPQSDVEPTQSEYCEVCFISFGSQEPRLQKKGKTVHIDCAKSA